MPGHGTGRRKHWDDVELSAWSTGSAEPLRDPFMAIKPLDKALVIQDSENFIEKLRNVASLVSDLELILFPCGVITHRYCPKYSQTILVCEIGAFQNS